MEREKREKREIREKREKCEIREIIEINEENLTKFIEKSSFLEEKEYKFVGISEKIIIMNEFNQKKEVYYQKMEKRWR